MIQFAKKHGLSIFQFSTMLLIGGLVLDWIGGVASSMEFSTGPLPETGSFLEELSNWSIFFKFQWILGAIGITWFFGTGFYSFCKDYKENPENVQEVKQGEVVEKLVTVMVNRIKAYIPQFIALVLAINFFFVFAMAHGPVYPSSDPLSGWDFLKMNLGLVPLFLMVCMLIQLFQMIFYPEKSTVIDTKEDE